MTRRENKILGERNKKEGVRFCLVKEKEKIRENVKFNAFYHYTPELEKEKI